MSEPSLQTQVDAARAYEALFVPALFEQWAPRVADAAVVQPHHKVLDVACGTGVLAREINSRIGPSGLVTALDPNPGMLAVASELGPAVQWRQGVAESLPFPDRSFDVVVSQFGLMFFADREAALREMLRVLRPDGRLVVAVWDALETMPAYATVVDLLQRFGGQAAANALRAPFVLGDREGLAALFGRAGAASTNVSTLAGTARFPSIRIMVEADLRGWLPVVGVLLTEEQIHRILQEADRALAAYADPEGRVSFPLSVHFATVSKR